MIALIFFLAASTMWQEDFAETTSVVQQLYDYNVEIVHQDGSVRLMANPQFEGFASAWLHVDKEIAFSENDALVIRIRGNENPVRLRYFFRKGECRGYHASESVITASEEWRDVTIPMNQAILLSGTEFPAALTPGLNPSLYVIIENATPGNFELEIDQISVVRQPSRTEEK